MTLRLASAAALLVLLAGPAFAVGPNCHDQIAQLKSQLSDNPSAKASLGGKVEQADRLCKENKDEEAQSMARQIRDQMSQASTKGQNATSGSSTSSGKSR
ncbi:MAG TPA: hypothetical protein VJ747_06220 [Stellaceae bacterium]|nr:hypothetical protein [Stellaceae bacterium]